MSAALHPVRKLGGLREAPCPRRFVALLLLCGTLAGCTTVVKLREVMEPLPGNVAMVSAGGSAACAVEVRGRLYCWGSDAWGILARPDSTCGRSTCRSALPQRVELPDIVTTVSVGDTHACAVLRGGRAFCWGSNAHGESGPSAATFSCRGEWGPDARCSRPVEISVEEGWSSVAAGDAHACGLTRTGRVLCWGWERSGRLGNASSRTGPAPRDIRASGPFSSVAADSAYGCALARTGTVWCWGEPPFDAPPGARSVLAAPFQPFPGLRFTAMDVGRAQLCVVTSLGQALCTSARGTRPTGPFAATPGQGGAGAPGFSSISVGDDHVCAVGAGGHLNCWGENALGQLGVGSRDRQPRPVPVRGEYLSVSAGRRFTCGVTSGHFLRCWGSNAESTLAQPTTSMEALPTLVNIPREPGPPG